MESRSLQLMQASLFSLTAEVFLGGTWSGRVEVMGLKEEINRLCEGVRGGIVLTLREHVTAGLKALCMREKYSENTDYPPNIAPNTIYIYKYIGGIVSIHTLWCTVVPGLSLQTLCPATQNQRTCCVKQDIEQTHSKRAAWVICVHKYKHHIK